MDADKKLIGEVRSLRKEVRELNYDIKNIIALLFDDIEEDDMEDDNILEGQAEDELYRLEQYTEYNLCIEGLKYDITMRRLQTF